MIIRQFSLGPQLDHADILGPAESRDFVDKERLTTKIYQNIGNSVETKTPPKMYRY